MKKTTDLFSEEKYIFFLNSKQAKFSLKEYPMNNSFLCIRCFTYNQSKYIIDALNGFTSQQTTFPFVCCIVDDASTDGAQKTISQYINKNFNTSNRSIFYQIEREYANILYAQHNTNKNCFFAVLFLKKNHYSNIELSHKKREYLSEWLDQAKYETICEGDDYWTDPNKLQRQVDFLESHPEYALSTENAQVLFTKTGIVQAFSSEPMHDVSLENLLIRRRFPTASAVYLRKYAKEFQNLNIPSFDTSLWAFLATKGKVHYNPVISSVYRRGSGVTETNKIKWAFTSEKINHTIEKYYHPGKTVQEARKQTLINDLLAGYRAAKKEQDKQNKESYSLSCLS